MNSLVAADYGGSSSSSDQCRSDDEENNKIETAKIADHVKNLLRTTSDSDDDDDDGESSLLDEDDRSKQKEYKKIALPSASSILSNTNSIGHVFNNPYKKAENAQIASLEKHVKMVATDAHTQMKNGKKICWNYRKGRCRFGSNCTYAHDSDLHMIKDNNTATTKLQQQKSETHNDKDSSIAETCTKSSTKTISHKKRPGLGDSIVPSKKVLKSYHSLKK